MDMDSQFLEMDIDPSALVCVNPYEVNPVVMERQNLSAADVNAPHKAESNVTLQPHWDTSCGGEFYRPPAKIELKMEVFGDLTEFIHQRPTSTSSVDELQTPIFDKKFFDFNVNVYPKDSQYEDIFVKLESDAITGNTCIITDNSQFKDLNILAGKVHQDDNINSNVGDMILQNSDPNIFSPMSETGSAYNCQISPTFENASMTVYNNVDNNSALSVKRQFSDVSSDEKYQLFNNGLETPEDSSCSNISHESVKRPSHLVLDLNTKSTTESNLATPSIIAELVELEEANFNILDFVENEEITFVNAEDIFPSSSLTATTSDSTKISAKKLEIPQKRPRKRRVYTDDDEDYVPPTKKNVRQRRRVVVYESDSEFESDAEIEIKPKVRPRGRPPKRTESISSDCSKEGDASKYRELRDKNNEASRKSRLKRKIKDMELEKEVQELEHKNIKLRAQGAALEKMVANLRDCVIKVMTMK